MLDKRTIKAETTVEQTPEEARNIIAKARQPGFGSNGIVRDFASLLIEEKNKKG